MFLRISFDANPNTYFVPISDCSFDTVSKAFELIGRPELTITNSGSNGDLTIDKDYALYDWDEIATVMTQLNLKSLDEVNLKDDVDSIGYVCIINEPYIQVEL